MDLKKQYILQAIAAASNNLRLSSEKIEVIALLKDHLNKSEELSSDISEMKKITQLSKFAIHLNEVYNFISQSKIDFLKISDKFKEHSHFLIRDLSALLDVVSPSEFQEILNKLIRIKKEKEEKEKPVIQEEMQSTKNEETAGKEFYDLTAPRENKLVIEEDHPEIEEEKTPLIKDGEDEGVDEISERDTPETFEVNTPAIEEKQDSEITKEEFLLNGFEEEELSFDSYVEKVLEPVKILDKYLKDIHSNEFAKSDIDIFISKMELNAKRSSKIGFKVLTNMHGIFAEGLKKIKEEVGKIDESFIESMRACLIVIVAVVRGKEVDITNYLNRAEKFGNQLKNKI